MRPRAAQWCSAVATRSSDVVACAPADHKTFNVDDTLCHNVARVMTSLLESKNSHAGIHAFVAGARERIVPKFFESISNDAMLFIYLELIGASEDKVSLFRDVPLV